MTRTDSAASSLLRQQLSTAGFVLLYLAARGRLDRAQSEFPFVALALLLVPVPGGAKRSFYPSARLFAPEEEGRG